MKYKTWILWFTAIAITIGAILYQRLTGPTYPKRVTLLLNDNMEYHIKLPRSQGGTKEVRIALPVSDSSVIATLHYKRYPVDESWKEVHMTRKKGDLVAFLPGQPPAGKLEYYVVLMTNGKEMYLPDNKTVIIRFRGEVPAWIIIPHILLMFAGMLLANLAALMAITRNSGFRLYTILTTASLLAGGMILGPIVQKYAFGEFWTGFPKGFDLTDNKTLIALVFWIVAFSGNLKKERPYLTIVAAFVTLIIFSIPHSAMGSELDYKTGKVKTGMIQGTMNLPAIQSHCLDRQTPIWTLHTEKQTVNIQSASQLT